MRTVPRFIFFSFLFHISVLIKKYFFPTKLSQSHNLCITYVHWNWFLFSSSFRVFLFPACLIISTEVWAIIVQKTGESQTVCFQFQQKLIRVRKITTSRKIIGQFSGSVTSYFHLMGTYFIFCLLLCLRFSHLVVCPIVSFFSAVFPVPCFPFQLFNKPYCANTLLGIIRKTRDRSAKQNYFFSSSSFPSSVLFSSPCEE